MDSELEMIRSEMDVTRDSLAHKIGELESQVRDTVSGATEAVTAAKEGVKDVVSSVSDTVTSVKESLKETFDINKHVADHPWGAFGIAVAVGAAGGFLTGTAGPRSAATPYPDYAPASPAAAGPAAGSYASTAAGTNGKAEPGVMGNVFSKLQALAVKSLVDVVQDMVRQSAPEPWRDGLQDIVKDLASQLTGEKKHTY